jgi:hypothetical protein
MIRAAVLFLGLVAAYHVPNAEAQDGHDETVVITGTIQAIDSNRIQIETRNNVSFQLTRVWVITTQETRYKRGRTRVEADVTRLSLGERVVVVARSEHTEDYSLRLLALQIELTGARCRRLEVKTPRGKVLAIAITGNCS